MTKPADIGSKKLISLSPAQWLKWVTQIPDIEPLEIVSSDFQWISRDSDVLIRSRTSEWGDFLVLNEVQLRYIKQMPRRMNAYAALAAEKYEIPIYPVLVNILPPSSNVTIQTSYDEQFLGLRDLREYRVVNLWEVDAAIVFEQSITSLLPFVPVLKGGGEVTIVREALNRLRREEKLEELEPLLAFFATFVLESELVRQIMRWDMAILRESPWYREILEEGEKIGINRGMERGIQQGIEMGIEQGIQQGEKQEIFSTIELILKLRFGDAGLLLLPEIQTINDLDTLRQIKTSLITVESLDQLRQIYQ